MSQHWIIRAENNEDYDSIDRVIVAACEGDSEAAEFVRKLRNDGDVLLSLIAEAESRIVGHIMMSRMFIETTAGDIAAVALAPLMVDPPFQNRGIGSLLTRMALSGCRDAGESIVFVLGHPAYYPRFGFSAELASDLQIPFKLQIPGAFMALELKPGVLTGIRGRVKYPKAFGLPAEWTTQYGGPIEVRSFVDTDEAAVVDIWFRSGKAAYTFLPAWRTVTKDRAAEIFRETIGTTCDIWVALRDREVVGYLALKGSYVDRLYVDPKAQRLRCGTRLLDFAKSVSPRGLQLHTHQENLAARAFYEKNGFQAVRLGMSPLPECAPDVEYHWNGKGAEASRDRVL